LRRSPGGLETVIATYVVVAVESTGESDDVWQLAADALTPAELASYQRLVARAAAQVRSVEP